MSNVLPSFDPTTGSGTFDSTLYNISGALVIHNLGIFDIQFTYPDSTQFIVDANSVRCKHLAGGFSAPIAWRTVTVPNTNNPYTATVIIEAYRAGTDEIPPEFIVPLTRQANVGGIVSSVSQVIQDAQPNGQILVEATPTGQPQNVLITTDGTATLRGTLKLGAPVVASFFRLFEDAANHVLDIETPQAGADPQSFQFVTWDGVSQRIPFSVGSVVFAYCSVGHAGNIAIVGGQLSTGSFGVPVIVAQTLRQAITVTTLQTILSFSIPVNGLYRLSAALDMRNGTAGNQPKLDVTFTDANGNADTGFFSATNSGATGLNLLNAANSYPANFGAATVLPVVLHCNVGTLSVFYQATGTPNDTVSILVERLA